MKLNNEFIQLDLTRETINPDKIIGGIYIPYSKKNAITKTITAKIKDINEYTEKKYNIHKGDIVCVDRYAIMSCNVMKDTTKEFLAIIRMDSVLLVKRNGSK